MARCEADPSAAPRSGAPSSSRPRSGRAPAARPAEPEPRSARAPRGSGSPRGIPGVRFVQESCAELKKVEWPDQHALVSGTAVVLIACLIVGAYL